VTSDRLSAAGRVAARALPAAVTAVAAALALRRLDDFDTWWHLASGRWIVTHGEVPRTDVLSFTVPDHPWINLQWLYDVALYGLYGIGGADLLVLTAAAAFATTVWLTVRNMRLWVGDVGAALLGLWVVFVAEERFIIRPEMVSFLLLEVVLWLLMTARAGGGTRLWLLVPVMLLWVNCHSLFIIGLFCIGCVTAGALVAQAAPMILPASWRSASRWEPDVLRRLLVAAAASAAVTVLNPYLLEGVLFPMKLLSRIDGSSSAFQAIGEFRRPFSGYFTTFAISAYQSFFIAACAVVVIAGLVALVARRRRDDAPLPGFDIGLVAMFAGLAYLSLLARRNIGVFVFGAAPVVAVCLAVIGAAFSPGAQRAMRRAASLSAPATLAAGLLLVFAVASNGYYRRSGVTHEFGLGTLETNFPINASAFAAEAGLPGRLYNDLTAGGYLTWSSGVEGGVFIDGRLEVYDTEFFSAYLSAMSNVPAWQRQVDDLGINTVLLFHRWANRHRLIQALARDPAWSLVYHDEVAIVFVRTAGHADVIARAREQYPAWGQRTTDRIDAPVSSWQAPIGRIVAMTSYAQLMSTLGAPAEALGLYEKMLGYDLTSADEARVRTRLGIYTARQGRREVARMHFEKALELDPDNRRVQQFLQELGG